MTNLINLVIACLVVIIFLRWLQGNLALPSGVTGFFAGWNLTQTPAQRDMFTKFLWDFAAIMLGVVALVWGAYLTHWAPQMFTFWGVTGLLMFYGVIAATIAASQARTGTVAKVTYRLALAAAIIVGTAEGINFLYYRFVYCDQACQVHKQEAAAAAAKLETERQLAIEKVRYPGCDRQKKPVTFSPKWVRINPDGSCAPDLYYVKQEVTLWAKQAGNDKPIGPIHWGEALPLDTEWIMSEDKTFNGFVQLSPPRYTQLFR